MSGKFFVGFGLILGGAIAVAGCEAGSVAEAIVAIGAGLMCYDLLWYNRGKDPQ